MTWNYSQSSGQLSHDGEMIATGYSGIGPGLNNPSDENVPFQGPLPKGTYDIGQLMADGGHMGPFVLPLNPWAVNNMFGRSGFFIHGDNTQANHSASNGCIILARQWRMMIAQSNDPLLTVTA
jgi:hypothetical protein